MQGSYITCGCWDLTRGPPCPIFFCQSPKRCWSTVMKDPPFAKSARTKGALSAMVGAPSVSRDGEKRVEGVGHPPELTTVTKLVVKCQLIHFPKWELN